MPASLVRTGGDQVNTTIATQRICTTPPQDPNNLKWQPEASARGVSPTIQFSRDCLAPLRRPLLPRPARRGGQRQLFIVTGERVDNAAVIRPCPQNAKSGNGCPPPAFMRPGYRVPAQWETRTGADHRSPGDPIPCAMPVVILKRGLKFSVVVRLRTVELRRPPSMFLR